MNEYLDFGECQAFYSNISGLVPSNFDNEYIQSVFVYANSEQYQCWDENCVNEYISSHPSDNVFSSDFQYNIIDYVYNNFDNIPGFMGFQKTDIIPQTSIDKYLLKKNSSNENIDDNQNTNSSIDVSQYYKDIFPNVDIVSNTFISSVTFVIGFVLLILVIKKGIKYFINVIKYKGFGSGLAKQDYDTYLNDKVNEDHENNFDL